MIFFTFLDFLLFDFSFFIYFWIFVKFKWQCKMGNLQHTDIACYNLLAMMWQGKSAMWQVMVGWFVWRGISDWVTRFENQLNYSGGLDRIWPRQLQAESFSPPEPSSYLASALSQVKKKNCWKVRKIIKKPRKYI